ncbi:cell division protein ZapD [Psychromonas ossibalaenae]|uniref:cell division protein ZapD n=1 Tax=Psychromonas ossibalaenae TaxID=444922 RepID=UPI000371DD51|nr:cell division protein ZapD [Psychromonas ossibalaenae]
MLFAGFAVRLLFLLFDTLIKMIAFEYPLNEKTRSYLRFEFLFSQIQKSITFSNESDAIAYFKGLFELIELSERCDIRHDLVKDLRLLVEQMDTWLNLEQADHDAVAQLIEEVESLIKLVSATPKQLKFYKSSRFLTSLRQRFFIPSGSCNFDLPQFHFWLAGDLQERQKDALHWFSHFASLEKALALFLKIKRSQGVISQQTAKNGFYQDEVENCSFVIIRVAKTEQVYPMISGHKQRFSVRFMSADNENTHAPTTEFEQICC